MKVFKLNKEQFKKLSKEYKKTYFGKLLYELFTFGFMMCCINFSSSLFPTFVEENIALTEMTLSIVNNIGFWGCVIVTSILYCMYINYLIKYIESKEK